MSQVDSQTVTKIVAKLTLLGYTVTEPKRYTFVEIANMENKQGVYLTDTYSTHYYLDNKLHRVDGPAVERADGYSAYYLDGNRHRVDGPAIESATGDKYYYLNDKLHRIDGPAVERANGNKVYYQNNELHRTDGPAIEHTGGHKEYYLNGKAHRIDGPAKENAIGDKMYYQDNKLHRTDGPAIEWFDGRKEYYLNNIMLSEQDHAANRVINDNVAMANELSDNAHTNDGNVITIMYKNKVVAEININA